MLGLACVDDVWPTIGAIAHTVLDGDDLTVENIRQECRDGRSLCFSSQDGVVICTLVPNRFRQDLELVVVLAVALGPHGAYEANLPQIREIAADLGASRVVFYARRRGWERKLGPEWKLRHVAYVMELSDGGR